MPDLVIWPNGPGDETNLSVIGAAANWQAVDENPHDSDATYVENPANGTWKRDLYNFENHTIERGTVNIVTVRGYCKRGNAAGDIVKFAIKIGGTVYEGSSQLLNAATIYTEFLEAWNINPNTGDPFTLDELDSVQGGENLYASGVLDPHVTQVRIVINFSEIPYGFIL